jgi:prepilin-type N-terminal cleavage/methylation domain-containing protein
MGKRRDPCADEGYSLVELMSVVAIIGILVAVAVASFSVSIERSRKVTCLHNQRLIDSAISQYQLDNNAALPPVDDVAGLALVQQYVTWPGGNYGRCASDPSVQYVYDHNTGIVDCPNHPR